MTSVWQQSQVGWSNTELKGSLKQNVLQWALNKIKSEEKKLKWKVKWSGHLVQDEYESFHSVWQSFDLSLDFNSILAEVDLLTWLEYIGKTMLWAKCYIYANNKLICSQLWQC